MAVGGIAVTAVFIASTGGLALAFATPFALFGVVLALDTCAKQLSQMSSGEQIVMKTRLGAQASRSRTRIWLTLTFVGVVALLICLYFLIARGWLLWSTGAAVAIMFTASTGYRWRRNRKR